MICGTKQNRWLTVFAPKPAARLRLFCFPYAGGGASIFSAWARSLPAELEVCAVQMPGREERIRERPLTNWKDVVESLTDGLIPLMDRPFALFGHSLGAVMAFEMARTLRNRQARCLHLFVSGRRAPQLPWTDPPTHNLSEDNFLRELRELAGTPEEVLQQPELMRIFIPLLRADFCLAETHAYKPESPLGVPISAYGGISDRHVLASSLDAWREHTTTAFRRVLFPGGHFFINEHTPAVLSELVRELQPIISVV